MNLITRVKTAVAAGWSGFVGGGSASAGHPYATGFFPSWPDQCPFVPLEGSSDLTMSSLVMACVNWAGTTIPSAPMQVVQQKDVKTWEPIPEHPLVELIADPNPYYSGITYWKAFAYWWLVYGNVFFYKARNESGAVVELWLLDSRAVIPEWTIETDNNERTIYYRYSGQGLPGIIPYEDIIHLRYGIDPNRPLLGLPPVRSLMYEVAVDQEVSIYSTQIMQNFGIPAFLVAPKPTSDGIYKMSAPDMDADIQKRTSGALRGKPLVFNKPMDITAFGFSPDQMAVEKVSRRPESRVCAVLGVPAIVLGFEVGLERSIYSNLKAAQEQAWTNFVIPTQDYITAVLSDQLLYETIITDKGTWPGVEDDTYRVIFDRSGVQALQPDRNELFTRESLAYKSGIKKRSECRSALGLETEPADEVYFIEPLPAGQTPGLFPADTGAAAMATQDASKKDVGMLPLPHNLDEIAAWWDETAPPDAKGLLDAEQVA
jgi:HK97 family phage portal protein